MIIESFSNDNAEKSELSISFKEGIEEIVLKGLRILKDLNAVKSIEEFPYNKVR